MGRLCAGVVFVSFAAFVALVLTTSMSACTSSFGASDPDSDGGASADGATTTEAAADITADGGTCFDFGNGAKNDFVLSNGPTTNAVVGNDGITLTLPSSSAEVYAVAQRAFAVPSSATHARLRIFANITTPTDSSISTSVAWYLGVVNIINGAAKDVTMASSAGLGLGPASTTSSSLLMRVNANGTQSSTTMTPVANVSAGAADLTAIFEVEWSTTTGMHVTAQVPPAMAVDGTPGTTLSGKSASAWTLSLGGAAKNHPTTTLVFSKVCLEVF